MEPEINIKPSCTHSNTKIVVLESVAGCEVTVTACALCGEHLDKPKTQCA
jgi:hypothetical protein